MTVSLGALEVAAGVVAALAFLGAFIGWANLIGLAGLVALIWMLASAAWWGPAYPAGPLPGTWIWLYRLLPYANSRPAFGILAVLFATATLKCLWDLTVRGLRVGPDGVCRDRAGLSHGVLGPFTWRQ